VISFRSKLLTRATTVAAPLRFWAKTPAKNFSDALVMALEKVNEQQVSAETLGQKVVSDP
jgi:flagellar hook-basal body complex protein FliE